MVLSFILKLKVFLMLDDDLLCVYRLVGLFFFLLFFFFLFSKRIKIHDEFKSHISLMQLSKKTILEFISQSIEAWIPVSRSSVTEFCSSLVI